MSDEEDKPPAPPVRLTSNRYFCNFALVIHLRYKFVSIIDLSKNNRILWDCFLTLRVLIFVLKYVYVKIIENFFASREKN